MSAENKLEICGACGQYSNLKPISKEKTYKIKGRDITVVCEGVECPLCGIGYFINNQEGELLNRIHAKYREETGLLTPEEIKKVREKYDLTQQELADILSISRENIEKYENGFLQSEKDDNLIKQFINENIPQSLIEKIKQQNRFFALPLEEREKELRKAWDEAAPIYRELNRQEFWEYIDTKKIEIENKEQIENFLEQIHLLNAEGGNHIYKAITLINHFKLEEDTIALRYVYIEEFNTEQIYILIKAHSFNIERFKGIEKVNNILFDFNHDFKNFPIFTEFRDLENKEKLASEFWKEAGDIPCENKEEVETLLFETQNLNAETGKNLCKVINEIMADNLESDYIFLRKDFDYALNRYAIFIILRSREYNRDRLDKFRKVFHKNSFEDGLHGLYIFSIDEEYEDETPSFSGKIIYIDKQKFSSINEDSEEDMN